LACTTGRRLTHELAAGARIRIMTSGHESDRRMIDKIAARERIRIMASSQGAVGRRRAVGIDIPTVAMNPS
jgi:hypothetical protein